GAALQRRECEGRERDPRASARRGGGGGGRAGRGRGGGGGGGVPRASACGQAPSPDLLRFAMAPLANRPLPARGERWSKRPARCHLQPRATRDTAGTSNHSSAVATSRLEHGRRLDVVRQRKVVDQARQPQRARESGADGGLPRRLDRQRQRLRGGIDENVERIGHGVHVITSTGGTSRRLSPVRMRSPLAATLSSAWQFARLTECRFVASWPCGWQPSAPPPRRLRSRANRPRRFPRGGGIR